MSSKIESVSRRRNSKLAAWSAGSSSQARNPKTLPLLVEIGCEEIPARFLEGAREGFAKALEAALRDARLFAVGAVREPSLQTYSTPRRLVAWAPRLLERQADNVEEVLGPPVKVAFDALGKPTRAAESFAEKNGARVQDLVRLATPKGEYMAVRKTVRGWPACELLAELLPSVILGLSFPKSMYWVARAGPRFVRPIRWMMALLGEGKQARTIPFQIAGVRTADITYGHRAVGKNVVRVRSFKEYSTKLRQMRVEIDPGKRRETVRTECKVLLEKFHLRVVPDKELEDWMVNSTEWPRALLGSFEDRFLHLPREILIIVMRGHQKYFAVEDRKGNLQPRFITVLNVDGDPKGLIRAGHERVLAAQFSDAEFFWNTDQRVPLHDRRLALAGVTYQAELGSYADKVRRMKTIASEICGQLEAKGGSYPYQQQAVMRAVEVSKCDLTTQMVREFPELQGIVGGLYARAQGEEIPEVPEAVYDHYRPIGLEDSNPRSIVGAIVSLADKLDSVVGGFAVGLEPTGSSDPFALRRAGSGIVKVLVELSLPIPLRVLVERALNQLNVSWHRPQMDVFSSVVAFLEERLRYYLESVRGMRYDTVRAVLVAGWDAPLEAFRRAEALEKIRDTADFEALSVAAKRIKNILAKSASAADWQPGEVDEGVLEAGEERELQTAYVKAGASVEKLRREEDYAGALKAIARLRRAVDRFFDKVLVMAEDRAVRENRLRLLGKLDQLFSGIAHFAEIAPAPQNVDASTSGTRD